MRTSVQRNIRISRSYHDRAAFEKENPVTAEVIEKGVDVLEDVAEAKAEDLLNLPANTLNFEIVVFPKGKEHHDIEI